MRIGTQNVLCSIEGEAARPLQVDTEGPGSDPFREWLAAGQPSADTATTLAVGNAKFLAPLRNPSKIVAIGLNYRDHAAEQNRALPSAPMLFSKAPSAIVGSGNNIRFDPNEVRKVDYEVELAVVIGRTATKVTTASALDHVFGYTVANDVSARDLQQSDGQFFRAKSIDTFCPLGPVIVSADEIRDVQDLSLRTRVNGEIRQDGNTSEMVFPVADALEYITRFITLEPGDVVLTGTPAGVAAGMDVPKFLQHGDVVEVEIDGLGTLTNTIITD